jgi:hypothetical protein
MPLKTDVAASATVTAAPVPDSFRARMIRDAPIGALISIAIGIVILLAGSLNLNGWMIEAIQSLIGTKGSSALIGSDIGGVLGLPNVINSNTTPSVVQYIYASFVMFPSNLSWIVGGFIVSFARIRKGRDDGNLHGGWDVFWYGLIAVEIPFAIFGIIFLLSSISPGSALIALQGFTGSVFLFYLLFFIQPTFWIGLLCSLVGSFLGAVAAKKTV